ncbi:MAG: NAD(+) diphosphatase [Legionellaceae bacterium]|nr:NAD(+) diphosphatase [Legionellaceae bacterium]
MTDDSFVSQTYQPTTAVQPALWFIFHDEEMLIEKNKNKYTPPLWHEIHPSLLSDCATQKLYLGTYDNNACYAVNLRQKPAQLESNLFFEHIRQSHELLNNDHLFSMVSRAKQLINWDKNTQFCGQCGKTNQLNQTEHSKTCTECTFMTFPHIAPAMLVLIWRDDELLLARTPQFKAGIYSILAGFVEPGETLEQTVAREVKEEAGIHIKNIEYVGSQPWPFPSNLMLGFTAEYDHGELYIADDELEDAQWFKLDQLPQLPKPMSLSRIMIDQHLTRHRAA